MRRRPEGRRTAALAALTLVATALVLAGTVEGAGDSLARSAARAWHGVFGDRPKPASDQHQRVLVVLSAPSLADRVQDPEGVGFPAPADISVHILGADLRLRAHGYGQLFDFLVQQAQLWADQFDQ